MQNVDAKTQRIYLSIFNFYFYLYVYLYLFYDWNVLNR